MRMSFKSEKTIVVNMNKHGDGNFKLLSLVSVGKNLTIGYHGNKISARFYFIWLDL